ncbi:MAG: hypothetical protein HRT68_06015 [Flavobacteriaceae bacterium]|nr:hypothetical protein [Flavobacteriaceae bacterium]
MKYLSLIFLTLSTLVSVSQNPDYKVGVDFINDYVKFCDGYASDEELFEWINSRNDLTQEFKTSLQNLIIKSRAEDPELGLGFDPILDAQDYPEQFELEQIDGDYIIVKGVDWAVFRLTIKLKKVSKYCLVDGAGVINVSEEKRIKR